MMQEDTSIECIASYMHVQYIHGRQARGHDR